MWEGETLTSARGVDRVLLLTKAAATPGIQGDGDTSRITKKWRFWFLAAHLGEWSEI